MINTNFVNGKIVEWVNTRFEFKNLPNEKTNKVINIVYELAMCILTDEETEKELNEFFKGIGDEEIEYIFEQLEGQRA